MTDERCPAKVHGTSTRAYRIHGCRCPEAVRAARRNWRRHRVPGQSHHAIRSRDPHVDEIAVERACLGEPVTLTVRERLEAAVRLTAKGLTARQIAGLLRVADRTVTRYRARAREAA